MGQNSFILYTEQKAVIDKLTDEQAGKLIKALYEYSTTGIMPQLDSILDLVITPFVTALDRNKEKYEKTCKKRAIAGAKGGKQKVANASKCKQEVANVADSDSVSDSDSENDSDSDTANAVIGSDSCVDGFLQPDSCVDEVVSFYEKNIGAITPYEFELLDSYRADFNDDIIVYALKLQVEAKAASINYAKAILNSWKRKNIKTLIEAQNENRKNITEKSSVANNTYHADNNQYSNLDGFYMN